ncbi:hypothetical protein H311_01388, partial [Anncaliia algerae PRA109]
MIFKESFNSQSIILIITGIILCSLCSKSTKDFGNISNKYFSGKEDTHDYKIFRFKLGSKRKLHIDVKKYKETNSVTRKCKLPNIIKEQSPILKLEENLNNKTLVPKEVIETKNAVIGKKMGDCQYLESNLLLLEKKISCTMLKKKYTEERSKIIKLFLNIENSYGFKLSNIVFRIYRTIQGRQNHNYLATKYFDICLSVKSIISKSYICKTFEFGINNFSDQIIINLYEEYKCFKIWCDLQYNI